MKALFSPSSPYARVMLTLFVCICSLFGAMFLSFILAIAIFDVSFFELTQLGNNLSNPLNVEILKFFQLFQAIGLFIFSPFIITWMLNERPLRYCYASTLPNLRNSLLVLLLIIIAIPAINFFTSLNARLDLPKFLDGLETWMRSTESAAAKLTEAFMKVDSLSDLLFNVLLMAVIPAVGEELLFRGVLLRQLNNCFKNIHWAIIISAVLFSALHMQFYGFVPRMLLGVMFGYLVVWSGSLWTSIIAHFINNFMAVIFYYLYNQGKVSKSIDTIGATSSTTIWAIVSIITITAILYLIYKKRVQLSE